MEKISSYQRLKKDFDILNEEWQKLKTHDNKLRAALNKIALMKGPDVVNAPYIAIEALCNEEEQD